MDDFGSKISRNSSSEFTLAEILEMENIYKEVEEQSLGQEFCQDLAMSFSGSSTRAGKSTITWEQVQNWFEDKHKKLHPESTSSAVDKHKELNPESASFELVVHLSDSKTSSIVPKSSQTPEDEGMMDLHELAYEAKSSKDNAWYDVAAFLTYRFLNTGELEVRVRFSGFGKEEDEWVNVRTGVRERSIPLEPSECDKVNVGDLVLCFQEREHHAVYCDAYVVNIQRRLHDLNGCRCIFVIRYDDDDTEERVHLGRICCRPVGCDSPAKTDTQKELFLDDKWKLSFLY
ncbi:protein SAWADEE HOMEODOMAIN HOMOLOG 1 isoform X2 [Morus notabilis]|uniref:protein SAWADEE HOMEODOMAIN HOMOLOG 1 isoform X2 n=1 Tax=Morus notabilis TaxID=981085 RepID=UPI000CED4F12|nr:protein SAWADEE HOMEODOMAIN HOMOLOG 1 isoform X2 [Morus notabilis]